MHLLFDPSLLTPGAELDEQGMREFWSKLVDWVADPRVRIGASTHAFAYDYYAQYGYPETRLNLQPRAMRPSFIRALNTLLSRVVVDSEDEVARSFSPHYVGSAEAGAVLASDVGATCHSAIGIATDRELWDETGAQIRCSPTPPVALDLCFIPGSEIMAEVYSKAREFYTSKRLHIVGGKVNQAQLAHLHSIFNFAEGIDWIPAELNKPPRNLDASWSGLQPDRDLTACIAGRIGHAASIKAAVISARRGVPHLEVRLENDLEDALLEHWRRASGTLPD